MDELVHQNKGKPLSLEQAIDMAAQSHKDSVGQDCNIECTKAQLKHYYRKSDCGAFQPSTKDEKNVGYANTNTTDW